MTQMTLPYQPHSATSREAAEAARDRAVTQRQRVLSHLQAMGAVGATDEEMQAELGMEGSTQRPRRGECVKAGTVRDSGLTRRTQSGRRATVWEATR